MSPGAGWGIQRLAYDETEKTVPWETLGTKDREHHVRRACGRAGEAGACVGPTDLAGGRGR